MQQDPGQTIQNTHVVYGFTTLKSLTDKQRAEHSHLQRDTYERSEASPEGQIKGDRRKSEGLEIVGLRRKRSREWRSPVSNDRDLRGYPGVLLLLL